MGIATNERGMRRQAEHIDAELTQMLVGDLEPQSLTQAEVGVGKATISKPPQAIPVWAWVHYGPKAIRVKAEVCGWSSTGAVAIRWPVRQRGIHRAWVWANALIERKPGEVTI